MFNFMKKVALKRHVLKTFTWRFLGTIDTIIISWFISGDIKVGLSIGGIEVFSKMILYFIHERLWYRSKFGVSEIKKD